MRIAPVLAGVLGVLMVVAACRDIEVANERQEFEWGTGNVRQLTYNVGIDRGATWSPEGDSLFYSAEAFPGLAGDRGVLLATPAAGGSARPVFAFLHAPQSGGARFHVAPALSPDGERLAFIEIVRMAAPGTCAGGMTADCLGVEPLFDLARILVRDRDETSSSGAVTHDFTLPGRAPDGGTLDVSFPYIEDFHQHSRVNFSIAWAPDGERLVYSDGTRLFLWQPGSGVPQPVPNTAYGVHPTWSADGDMIAFTRQVAADSADVSCVCGSGDRPRVFTRRVFDGVRAQLTVIRPDGTLIAEPGIGVDPAFGPDGALYASSAGRIVRIDVASGNAVPVAGGEGGYDPQPSPDGTQLAFMKLMNGGYDLWVVQLGAQ